MEPSVARQWLDYHSFLYKGQSGVFFAVQQICFQNQDDLENKMTEDLLDSNAIYQVWFVHAEIVAQC